MELGGVEDSAGTRGREWVIAPVLVDMRFLQ